jgi:hypothetical protein
MLHLLAGIRHLQKEAAVHKEALHYLAQTAPAHRSLLATMIGAGLMQPGLKSETAAATLTSEFIDSANLRITETDRLSLKHLLGERLTKDNRELRAVLVTFLAAAIYGLYARIRKHETNSGTKLPGSESAPIAPLRCDVNSNHNQ